MVGEPAQRRATYQDVLDAPRHVIAEVIAGELHTSPRPRTRHARASSRLGSRLGRPFDEGLEGPGGWIILDEPELHLGSDVVATLDIAPPDGEADNSTGGNDAETRAPRSPSSPT